MANFFSLDLDTTPPQIEIIAPSYTITDIDTEIWINSNETLAEYQDIYFIDAKGNRHYAVFEYQRDKYYGKLNFNNFAIGLATLYVRVKDVVNNISDLYTKTINICQGINVKIDLYESINNIEVYEFKKNIDVSEYHINISLSEKQRNITFVEIPRIIGVKET